MKWLLGGLLVLNLAVAGIYHFMPTWRAGSSEAAAPLNVDRLSLRSQSRHTDTQPPGPAPVESPTEALCVEWRGLTPDEFAQAREQLKSLAASRPMSFTETPTNTRHWVIFPPLPSAQSANEKLSELTAVGVQDAFVVKDGPWRHALSLGLYANGQASDRRINELEAKGVLGTRVELVPRKGTDFYFVVKSQDQDVLKSLSNIKLPYPNSRQSRVACPS